MPSEYLFRVLDHIRQVATLMNRCSTELVDRGMVHDTSKFWPEEYDAFEANEPFFKTAVYGSEEYIEACRRIQPAIEHHYSVNRHHPEFFKEAGVSGMNLLDVLEMVCDWIAAARREHPENTPNLAMLKDRFHIDDQLAKIIENTLAHLLPDEGAKA